MQHRTSDERRLGTETLGIGNAEPSPRSTSHSRTSSVRQGPHCEAVPEVTEGCSRGFWHFCHPARLAILKFRLQEKQYLNRSVLRSWGRCVQISEDIWPGCPFLRFILQ